MAAEDLQEVKVDVGVLKTQVDTLTKLCEKMDTVIEKLVDHQDVIITQIYNDMDKRRSDVNEDIKDGFRDVYDEIKKNYEKGLEAQNRNLWMIIVTFVGGVLGFIYQLGGK